MEALVVDDDVDAAIGVKELLEMEGHTVAATHDGTAMDYLYFSKKQPTKKTLPFVQIPTTSGTGS